RHQRQRHGRGHGDARPRSRPPGALPRDRAPGGCAGLRLGGGRAARRGGEPVRLVLREALLIFRRAPLLSALSVTTIAFSLFAVGTDRAERDRKSTRLNSSHGSISYAVCCLKKKSEQPRRRR